MKNLLTRIFKREGYKEEALKDFDFSLLSKKDMTFILNEIANEINENPNDFDLGKRIREIYIIKGVKIDGKKSL